MKKYLHLLKISFEDFLEYRLDFAWQIAGIGLSTLVLILFWLTLKDNSNAFESFSKQDLIAYYVYMGLISAINSFPIWYFTNYIVRGDIVNLITKPLSYFMHWFIILLPKKLVLFTVYVFIATILLLENIKLFPSTSAILHFIYAFLLGILGTFILNYTIGLLAIWLKRVYGITILINTLEGLFAGKLIPIILLPALLQNISTFLPMRYFIYFPIEILQGNLLPQDILKNLTIEIFWLFLLSVICYFTWKKGLKSLDVVGI